MARIKVNPNRMELSKLTKRLTIAKKGHKLMKDKQEQLVRYFLDIVKESFSLRDEVERELVEAYKAFLVAKIHLGEEYISQMIIVPNIEIDLQVSSKNIMNLKLPQFKIHTEGNPFCYSPLESSTLLDYAIELFEKAFKKLLKLAEIEKILIELSQEIISTRRRVNALEYILIPNIRIAIKEIKSKLAEMERAAIVQIMFLK